MSNAPESALAKISELEVFWEVETCLRRPHPRLLKKPQLRQLFLRELVDIQQRAECLQTVLNPTKLCGPVGGDPSRLKSAANEERGK